MAYTGNGTQSSPYIVDNWADLKAAAAIRGAWVALDPDAPCKVIDLLDTEDRDGIHEPLQLYASILGNGWIIRNLIAAQAAVYSEGALIQDLQFESMLNLGAQYGFTGKMRCERCRFSIYTSKSSQLFYLYNSRFTNCAFSLYFADGCSAEDVFFGAKLNRCCIRLDGFWNGTSIAAVGELKNCYITGSMTLRRTLWLTDDSVNAASVICLALTGSGSVENNDETDCSVVETSRFAETVTPQIRGSGWHCVTSAQLRNAQYMAETIGFPCTIVNGE